MAYYALPDGIFPQGFSFGVFCGVALNDLWDGTGNFVDDNTLSVYIRRLREKVETDASHPQRLITIRGFGYQWKEV